MAEGLRVTNTFLVLWFFAFLLICVTTNAVEGHRQSGTSLQKMEAFASLLSVFEPQLKLEQKSIFNILLHVIYSILVRAPLLMELFQKIKIWVFRGVLPFSAF